MGVGSGGDEPGLGQGHVRLEAGQSRAFAGRLQRLVVGHLQSRVVGRRESARSHANQCHGESSRRHLRTSSRIRRGGSPPAGPDPGSVDRSRDQDAGADLGTWRTPRGRGSRGFAPSSGPSRPSIAPPAPRSRSLNTVWGACEQHTHRAQSRPQQSTPPSSSQSIPAATSDNARPIVVTRRRTRTRVRCDFTKAVYSTGHGLAYQRPADEGGFDT